MTFGDGDGDGDAASASETTEDSATETSEDTGEDPVDHCAVLEGVTPIYGDAAARWVEQDELSALPAQGLVFTGSSSIRRWESLARSYAGDLPVQRGIGGAELGEIALYIGDLALRHEPRGLVIYAGTNDLAHGVPPEEVLERLRCLLQRVRADAPELPVWFIGVTPNPARWAGWSTAEVFNAQVAELAEQRPQLHFIDVATAFLATGQPPDPALFVADQLHLSPAGYELWDAQIRPAIRAVLPDTVAEPGAGLQAGARVRIDLGPSNPEDGELTPSPDWQGGHWNNWHEVEGDVEILPGEHLDALVDSEGQATGLSLLIAGSFVGNGRQNGGLLWPAPELLGAFATGSATGDFFYADDDDKPGALSLRGLDPAQSYTLRLFAAREDPQTRVTSYTVHGEGAPVSATLQTSGAGAGSEAAPTNDDSVLEFTGLSADAYGQLHMDLSRESGDFAYLSALEIARE